MEIIITDIKDIMYELKQATARVGVCIDDADRGLRNSVIGQQEGEPRLKTIDSLFAYLCDAKHDMARAEDDLKELHNKLEALVEIVEYEAVRKEAGL